MLGNFPGKCHSTFVSSLLSLSAVCTPPPPEIFTFTSKVYCYFEAIRTKDKGQSWLYQSLCWKVPEDVGLRKETNCCNSRWRIWRLECKDFWTSQGKGRQVIHIMEGQKEVRLHKVSDIYCNRLFIKSLLCLHSVNFLVPFQNEPRLK